MKLISAAIALLASVAVVSSSPLYNSSYSSDYPHHDELQDDPETTSDWWPTETNSDWWPTETTKDPYSTPTETPDSNYCAGFKITSQTEPDITWSEDSNQEVEFDFTGSNIELVEYVDLVRYEDKAVVDEWATGPFRPDNPRTGLHEVHLHHSHAGYFQFLVVASTSDDHHCKYYSGKFKITSNHGAPSPSSQSYVAHAAQLQDTHSSTSDDYYSPHSSSSDDNYPPHPSTSDDYDSPDTTTDTWHPTSSQSPYSEHANSKPSNTKSLVALFDSIVENLWKLSSDDNGSWDSHVQTIEDDFKTIKNDIELGHTSGSTWIQHIDKLEKDLDIIKTSGTGQWTDHISSLELVLDQLKDGAWEDTYNALLKELSSSDDLTSTSSYYSTSSYSTSNHPDYVAYHEASSSAYDEEPSSTSEEAYYPTETLSYYNP